MFKIGPAWGSQACVRFCPPKEIPSLLAFSQLRRLIIHWASAPLEGCPLWGPLHSNHQGVQTNVLKDSTSGSELGRACPLGRRTPPFLPCPPPRRQRSRRPEEPACFLRATPSSPLVPRVGHNEGDRQTCLVGRWGPSLLPSWKTLLSLLPSFFFS